MVTGKGVETLKRWRVFPPKSWEVDGFVDFQLFWKGETDWQTKIWWSFRMHKGWVRTLGRHQLQPNKGKMFKQLKPQKQTYCFISDSFENIPDYFGDRQICIQVGFLEHTWTRKVWFFWSVDSLDNPILTPKCNEVPQLLSSIRPQWCWFRNTKPPQESCLDWYFSNGLKPPPSKHFHKTLALMQNWELVTQVIFAEISCWSLMKQTQCVVVGLFPN